METDTVEHLQKLKNSMEIGRQFTVEEVNRAKPRIILYDVPTSLPEDMIQEMVFRQNDLDIKWSKLDEECVLKFRMGPKEKELCNWVLQVSPAVRNTLLGKIRLSLDWQKCRELVVTRCFKCQGFGHISRICKNEEVCSIYAEKKHNHRNCHSKEDKTKQKNALIARKLEEHVIIT